MAGMNEAGGGQAVRIISLNADGLNSSIKRTKIMRHIKNQSADIMFIQETHLRNCDHRLLNRPWIGQIFHSKFNLKTRGTIILIRKNVNFKSTSVITDQNGHYVIVSGILYQKPVILMSVYGPNWDDHSSHLNSHLLLLGGDFNCVRDPTLDRSSARSIAPSRMAQTLCTFMDQYGYIDPWRFLYPSARQYSFFSPHEHCSFSWIDYFIVDKSFSPYSKERMFPCQPISHRDLTIINTL